MLLVIMDASPSSFSLRLDGSSATPAYLQVAQGVTHLIESGKLSEGSALPSERDLSSHLGLSRVTVRQALRVLEAQGLVVRRHGSGTFVAPRRIVQPLSALTGFSEDMRARGLTPGGRVLSLEVGRPTPQEAMNLGQSPLLDVVRLKRLRTADGDPLAIEMSVLPTRLFDRVPRERLECGSLYEVLRERGFVPSRAMQHLRALDADAETARLLHLSEGGAVLATERVTWDANGGVLEYARSQYRGDRYDFIVELQH